MRRKQIIKGFKNSQKFRFLLKPVYSTPAVDFGMVTTIQQFFDGAATTATTMAVHGALTALADRMLVQTQVKPTGIGIRTRQQDYTGNHTLEVDVQIDLLPA